MLIIIGGKHKKRKLISPKSSQVRPTASQLREALFNICQQEVEGSRFLDLFAGSGVIGLEALSRGARHATFVEKNRSSLSALKQNIALLKEEGHTTIIPGDVLKILPFLNEKFAIIYADPPYGIGLGEKVVQLLDTYPLLEKGGRLFIEDSTPIEWMPKNLKLEKARKFGRAMLFEFSTESAHS